MTGHFFIMIFHTAAEENYYNYFFKNWHKSIKKIYKPCPAFSLRFVGPTDNCDVKEYCTNNGIILDVDPITLDEIQEKYKVSAENAKGYYAVSRWISLPELDDHVCMTDIDLVQLHPLDYDLNEKINHNNFISISRKKVNHSNKMMFLGFNKDFISKVKELSFYTLNKKKLRWDLDTEILKLLVFGDYKWEEYYDLFCLDTVNISQPKIKFGYFSSLEFNYNDVTYPLGLEAKRLRYKFLLKKLNFIESK